MTREETLQKRREASQKKFDEKIIAKYGSIENYIDSVNRKRRQQIAVINEVKSNPLVAKANRNKALTGNPYYTQRTELGKDSIHCSNCGQRLGGLSFNCPICNSHEAYVYGKMLNNPADKRWNDPLYNKSKFTTRYRTSYGTVTEVSPAEQGLQDRMKKMDNKDDYK